MKTKDYFRLAKISLKSRKQSTKSTVRGISFGMILLIPVIFIALGLFVGISGELNKNPVLLYAKLDTSERRTGLADKVGEGGDWPIISAARGEDLADKLKGVDTIKFEQIFANYSDFEVVFDGGEKQPVGMFYEYENERYELNNLAAIIDLENSTNNTFITQKAIKANGGSVFAAGGEFTGSGKGQVVVSELLLEMFGLKAENVINKNLTAVFEVGGTNYGNVRLDDDNIADNNSADKDKYFNTKEINLFYNYKVVGVIKKDITLSSLAINDLSRRAPHIMSNLFFLSDKSLYMPGGDLLEPTINSYPIVDEQGGEERYMHIATYTQGNFDELNKEYIGLGTNSFSSHPDNSYRGDDDSKPYARYAKASYFFDVDTYAEQDKIIKTISREISLLFDSDDIASIPHYIGGGVYTDMKMMYDVFTYLVLFLSVMGGIIFFAAIVNLFNSIVHSVDSRRHYLGVMRAIGAKNSTIPKMYFAESIALFRRSLLWILIFSGIICTGIKIALDESFKYINNSGMLPFSLGIDTIYIPIAIGIGLAALLLIGLVFSVSCSRKVAKKPIMSILGDA